MNEKTDMLSQVSQLIEQLAGESPVVREQSRNELIDLSGHDVARALVTALTLNVA